MPLGTTEKLNIH